MKYQALFGFNRLPFDRSLNSNELFRAPALDELNSRLRYLVETRAIGLLTSEPGCGKSTALRRLRDDLHPEQVRTLYLCDTAGNPADFFRQIALELGIEPLWSRVLTLRAIKDEIARLHSQRHLNVLLLVDEAQALRHDVLALIPLLTNFDWDSDAKIAVLLAGQTGLRQKLRLAHLEPLAQRLTIRYALQGFDRETTKLYLEHRLKIAGLDRPLFTETAIEALHQASLGVMRRIDNLAHHALAAAANAKATILEPEHVLKAAEELRT
jgi:general secretion pathway protein A